MSTDFRVQVHTEGRAAIIAVSGELDLSSSPSLEAELERVSGTESELLMLDLRGLEFMDSTGLSTIVKAHQQLTEGGRVLYLIRGPQQVQRLLDLTGVADRIPLADTPEEILNGA